MSSSANPSFNMSQAAAQQQAAREYAYAANKKWQNPANMVANSVDETVSSAKHSQYSGIWNLLLVLVVLTILFMVIFWILQPAVILEKTIGGVVTDKISWSTNFFLSLIIAILIIFGIWAFKKISKSK